MYNPNFKDFRIKPMTVQMRVWHTDAIYELCRNEKMPFSIMIENILNNYFKQNPIEDNYNEWGNNGERANF